MIKDDDVQKEIILGLIDKLQPPRPTCSTCKSYSREFANSCYCGKWVRTGRSTKEFGCTLHSDYEEVKDE